MGRWRIADMDMLASDDIDLAEPADITFSGSAEGDMAFGATLDVRYGARDGAACAEFTWQGFDEGDPVCGRGWAALVPRVASSATSSSTKATIQAPSPSTSDFFSNLLDDGPKQSVDVRAYLVCAKESTWIALTTSNRQWPTCLSPRLTLSTA